MVRIFKSGIHRGEEKVVVGNEAAGMINFSGCHLACKFCYTPETSVHYLGTDHDQSSFSKVVSELIDRGAKNINLISPTHVWSQIEEVLAQNTQVPLVLKISGYESEQIIDRMSGVASVLVPDFKVYGTEAARSVHLPFNYGPVAERAMTQMLKTYGETRFTNSGQMARGILVRHLMMPGFHNDSIQVVNSLGGIGFHGFLNLMTYFLSPGRGIQIAPDHEVETLRALACSFGISVMVNGKVEVKNAYVA